MLCTTEGCNRPAQIDKTLCGWCYQGTRPKKPRKDRREAGRRYYQKKRAEDSEYLRTIGNRPWLDDLKASTPCADCGQIYPACVMDFDHRPGEEKLFRVAGMVTRRRELVEAEIEKCDIVCSNCHRIRTHLTRKGRNA